METVRRSVSPTNVDRDRRAPIRSCGRAGTSRLPRTETDGGEGSDVARRGGHIHGTITRSAEPVVGDRHYGGGREPDQPALPPARGRGHGRTTRIPSLNHQIQPLDSSAPSGYLHTRLCCSSVGRALQSHCRVRVRLPQLRHAPRRKHLPYNAFFSTSGACSHTSYHTGIVADRASAVIDWTMRMASNASRVRFFSPRLSISATAGA